MSLSKRLKCIAGFIGPSEAVADIGTDHGYIPIWLAENDHSRRIFASDIRKGPLNTAVENARNAGVDNRIEFRLCSGLEGYKADDADTVIIAGMGGETIIEILSAAPWTLDKKLILQPQSKISELRSWLNEKGYDVAGGDIVDDTGRLYIVWKVQRGRQKALSVRQLHIDDTLLNADKKLLAAYIDELIKKTGYKISGMKKSAKTDPGELEEYEEALRAFAELREEITNADS